jgi:hypothetical protein
MRCCESPTTSIAAETLARERTDPRDVTSAILFREILKPLAQGLGPMAEIALGAVADEIFVGRKR